MPFRDRQGSRAALEGAKREQGGAAGEHRGSKKEHYKAMQKRSTLQPELAALYPAIAAYIINNNILLFGSVFCCLKIAVLSMTGDYFAAIASTSEEQYLFIMDIYLL